MLLISSWIRTVLPTPAPPNRPILPPFAYGQSRSTTLMPVGRISGTGFWSTNSGAAWWMARRLSNFTGPCSSIGSPMTFMMRPSVPSPTGTEMASPVSVTSWPRVRPSDESIAIVRTMFSPRCWATSRIRRLPLLSVSSAFMIAGRCPSNSTSTTAPITWLTRPFTLVAVSVLILVASLGRSVRSENSRALQRPR